MRCPKCNSSEANVISERIWTGEDFVIDTYCIICGERIWPEEIQQIRERNLKRYESNSRLTRTGIHRIQDKMGMW
jgi:transcriptional regulator NrdR family protein